MDPEPLADRRIEKIRPLVSPALLAEELPVDAERRRTVLGGRRTVVDALDPADDRLVLVVGPCSVHDPAAALDYARRLRALADEVADDLVVVMRVYFEKPRTVVGWKGLINDPGLDGGFDVNRGLRQARRLLRDITGLGLPVGCEYLDPIMPQYLADMVSWGSIGARTAESQVHRQLASGLSMPIGVKNSTDGEVQGALDAVRAAAAPHVFTGITPDGVAALLRTRGNLDCHIILRGGRGGPNYHAETVNTTLDRLGAAGLPRRLMIDASHGNSGKDHRRQPAVVRDIAGQIAAGQRGIVGVMVESFLAEGRQDIGPNGPDGLEYGRSVTDACLSWERTVPVVRELAEAVARRRAPSATPVG